VPHTIVPFWTVKSVGFAALSMHGSLPAPGVLQGSFSFMDCAGHAGTQNVAQVAMAALRQVKSQVTEQQWG